MKEILRSLVMAKQFCENNNCSLCASAIDHASNRCGKLLRRKQTQNFVSRQLQNSNGCFISGVLVGIVVSLVVYCLINIRMG